MSCIFSSIPITEMDCAIKKTSVLSSISYYLRLYYVFCPRTKTFGFWLKDVSVLTSGFCFYSQQTNLNLTNKIPTEQYHSKLQTFIINVYAIHFQCVGPLQCRSVFVNKIKFLRKVCIFTQSCLHLQGNKHNAYLLSFVHKFEFGAHQI